MSTQRKDKVRQHMVDAVTLARERAPDIADLFKLSLQHYYGLADPQDVIPHSVADPYGAAMTHWRLGQEFVSGQSRVRVYNPNPEQYGWYCSHTVVKIVNDNMPSLFNSVTMEINWRGLALHSAFRPVYRVQRDGAGMRAAVEADDDVQRPAALTGDIPDTSTIADREARGVARFEPTIHIEIDWSSGAGRLQALHDGLMRALGDVRTAVEDWNPMQTATQAAIDALAAHAAQPSTDDVERAEIAETQAFLSWILERHFTFLGYRGYELTTQDDGHYLRGTPDTGLGALREALRDTSTPDTTRLAPGAAKLINAPGPTFLTRTSSRTTVYRPRYLDYVGIKLFDAEDQICG